MDDEVTTFIGVDLAWRSSKNHSCVAVARGGKSGAELIHYSVGIYTLRGVLDCVRAISTNNSVIAIDAPLIIKNQTGQRPCVKLIGMKFGRWFGGQSN